MKLILMRHAKSDWSTPSQGDHDRALNAHGQADAPKVGKWLRDRGHVPTAILCSSAKRTRETLARMRLRGVEPTYLPALYNAPSETILALVQDRTDDCLLVVGHNPGIGDAAGQAVADPPAHADFARYPTGACTIIDLSDGLPGRLIDFAVPGDL
ncbi:SixA phosphatase family protein [Jannaschia rubra]|uniref:Phosphohistidine phosphatase SixA n=1 Tax=Jannaschia rubra TaxID=282197 RepID=A0A0M6XML2_9RHOB|nr:histidine phosphatase family protein [Jannaschia rubra]CTQ31807.1 phosphohistidine phosphatase SixA [Jannaschia rubra]SFG53405.1 phosphohistidine phosphatase [Jannaschia rubra]